MAQMLFDPQTFSGWLAASGAPLRVSVEDVGGISAASAALIGVGISTVGALIGVALSNWHNRKVTEQQREYDWTVMVAERYHHDLMRAVVLIHKIVAENDRDYALTIKNTVGPPPFRHRYRAKLLNELLSVMPRRASDKLPAIKKALTANSELLAALVDLNPQDSRNAKVDALTEAVDNSDKAWNELEFDLLFQLSELESYPPKLPNHFHRAQPATEAGSTQSTPAPAPVPATRRARDKGGR